MQMKSALLSLTAAFLIAAALTGCGSSTKEGMHANNVSQNGNHKGMTPYSTMHNNNNRNIDNYGHYRKFNTNGYGVRPYEMDGMNRDHAYQNNRYGANPYSAGGTRYGHGAEGTQRYGMNGISGAERYNGTHMYGTGKMGNDQGMHQGTKVEMSQKISKKIAAMPGVNSANVMLTNNNAYVAISTKNGTKMNTKSMSMNNKDTAMVSSDMKAKIGAEVKKMAPNCKNVYVTADANFMDRMNEFSNMAMKGRPIHGFTTEFQEMVNRLFPANNAPHANSYMAPGVHR